MIEILRRANIINDSLIRLTFPARELDHKRVFFTYISEIPSDFMNYVGSSRKAERVREHLTSVYGRPANQAEIQLVIKRIVNLAHVATHSRDEIEDRLAQAQFKNENWQRIGRCEVCGLLFSGADTATIDHVLPLSLGGEDSEHNWQLVCRLCNDQKGRHFGCCDVARALPMENARFFNSTIVEQLQRLLDQNLALRYEIFELGGRRCADCNRRAKETKLILCIRSLDRMVTVDNLYTSCERCVINNQTHRNHQIR